MNMKKLAEQIKESFAEGYYSSYETPYNAYNTLDEAWNESCAKEIHDKLIAGDDHAVEWIDAPEEDAKLIAAAPDLLAALEELLAHATFAGIAPRYEQMARDAIKKARGE